MKRYSGVVPALLTVLLVGGCASDGPAPVEDRSVDGPHVATASAERRPAPTSADRYRVERGDTLYSIAFRHGVDYRELAGWNGIAAPYTIYVGQELRVTATARASTPRTSAATRAPSTAVVAAGSASVPAPTSFAPSRPTAADVPKPTPFEPVAAQPASPPPAPPKETATAPPVAPVVALTTTTPTAPIVEPPKPSPAPLPAEPMLPAGEVGWRWPADGQVVGTYAAGDQTRQGIDIAGKAGDPVRAAADGAVVYSGNGLIGYGELIIIKHNPSFLSAYGHNRKRLVKEGDRVKAGQVVAEMGSSSASRDSLHFEIRRNGKPANPVDYLPRR
jgi:lipoprotein NlpD